MVLSIYTERQVDPGCRLRYMQALTEQLVKDHADLCRQWESFKRGKTQFEDIEVVIRAVCWIKQELFDLMELNNMDIEGQISEKINEIERDLSEKYRRLDKIITGNSGF